MTRNLRVQLADLAEAWLRAARPDLSRERATDLISDWPLAEPWDEETTALVLSRFPAELVPVAGVDFLPSPDASGVYLDSDDRFGTRRGVVVADAAVLVAESTAEPTDWSQYGPCAVCDKPIGAKCVRVHVRPGTFRGTPHMGRPLVEVTAQPTAEAVQCGFRVCDQDAAEGDEYCTPHRNEHDSAMRGARAWDRAMGS